MYKATLCVSHVVMPSASLIYAPKSRTQRPKLQWRIQRGEGVPPYWSQHFFSFFLYKTPAVHYVHL